MEEGRGIHIKQFGTFTFEPIVSSSGSDKNQHGPSMKLRPCFIEGPELRKSLQPSSVKQQLAHRIDGSIYQQGIRISYLNPVPIANGSFYKSDFVRQSLDIIFRAIVDLITRGYDVLIEFEDLASIRVVDKCLRVSFSRSLATKVKEIEESYPKRSVNASLSAISPKKIGNNISTVYAIRNCKKDSLLDTLERPNSAMLSDIKQRIERLSESSKDLCNVHAN